MNNKLQNCLILITAALLGLTTVSLKAGGFRLPDQDAFATARGEAFAATADTPAAIYYNPAGITQLQGNNFRGGIYGIYLEPIFHSQTDGTFHNQDKLHAVAQAFYTYTPENSPLSFGVGLYAPYGLGLKWPQDTGFRTLGLQSSLTYLTLNPVIAWKVFDNLSIGGGPTINYAMADFKEGLFWPAQPFDQLRFLGDGWDVGYDLGALWKPHEKLSLGVSFRSSTSATLKGHTAYYNTTALPLPGGGAIPPFPRQRVSAEAEFPFPLNAIFGISFRPNTNWNFEFNADYADWSAVGTVTIKQATPFPPLLPKNLPVVFNWQPSWYYEFGATRYLGNHWSISAGYIFNETSTPDAHYTPLVADVDKHFLSIGTGYRGDRFGFDIAYQFGYGPTHNVKGSAPSATGQTADGGYEFLSHAVLVSVGWHF